MRTNYSLSLVGDKVVLVPYRRRYVARYHEWMKDPWIREMTASEPLSLEEEYEMQASWRDDNDKCTFIVLDKSHPEALSFGIPAMAGDVNLFLNDPDGDRSIAEIEIMIAEKDCRRKGLGKEALLLMMQYGVETLGITRFYSKINEDNGSSISLFESVGYHRCNYVAAFKEFELEWLVGNHDSTTLFTKGGLRAIPYHVVDEDEDEQQPAEKAPQPSKA